jgi:hypothetical protein
MYVSCILLLCDMLPVSSLTLQVLRQVDDSNSFEWALLDTDTASYTQLFTDVSNLLLSTISSICLLEARSSIQRVAKLQAAKLVGLEQQTTKCKRTKFSACSMNIKALHTLLVGATSIHSLPIRTTGHIFLHSCRHQCSSHEQRGVS